MTDTLQLLNILRNNKTVDNRTYQNFRNLYRKELSKAKKTFNEQFIHKAANKPKAMWEIITKIKKKLTQFLITVITFVLQISIYTSQVLPKNLLKQFPCNNLKPTFKTI
jgi:hypothetical protein